MTKRARLFVAHTGDQTISIYDIDPATGSLDLLSTSDAHGGVGALHLYGDVLLATHVSDTTLASFRLEGDSLSLINKVDTGLRTPAHLITDESGRFLMTSYYSGGGITVHRLGTDGTIGEQVQHLQTGEKAHAVFKSSDDRFIFVPHVCPTNKTVQLRFDAGTGRLSSNDPPELAPPDDNTGPRHICFRPGEDVAYTVNEQGNTVTAHRFDRETGLLESFQTISTLPAGYDQVSHTAHVEVHPNGRWLFASNRGYHSIAGFEIGADGTLNPFGHYEVPEMPRSFNIEPSGSFLYCAGEGAARLVSFRIDQGNGHLDPLDEYETGSSPFWVMAVGIE